MQYYVIPRYSSYAISTNYVIIQFFLYHRNSFFLEKLINYHTNFNIIYIYLILYN